jgi:CRP-like cAMP-binding protein
MTDPALYDMLLKLADDGAIASSRRAFDRNEVVFEEGDLGTSVHLILAGSFFVRLEAAAGDPLIVDILGRGDIFGEFALFSSSGRRATGVAALTAGETLELEPEAFRSALHDRPDVFDQLVGTIVAKTDGTTRRLVDLLRVPAELRVLRAILQLTGGEDGGVVALTQQDLARFAGTSRSTANHVLREEARKGTLSIERGHVVVKDTQRLARRAKLRPSGH